MNATVFMITAVMFLDDNNAHAFVLRHARDARIRRAVQLTAVDPIEPRPAKRIVINLTRTVTRVWVTRRSGSGTEGSPHTRST